MNIDSSAPTVGPDSYLTLHYRLSDGAGNDYVSTFDLSPATLQMGGGQLAEPLEKCLIGLAAHQRRVIDLACQDAFGEHNPQLIERIALSALPAGIELRENSLIEFSAPDGEDPFAAGGSARFSGFLRELTDTSALFDFNHPLAGKPIRFEVEIIGIM